MTKIFLMKPTKAQKELPQRNSLHYCSTAVFSCARILFFVVFSWSLFSFFFPFIFYLLVDIYHPYMPLYYYWHFYIHIMNFSFDSLSRNSQYMNFWINSLYYSLTGTTVFKMPREITDMKQFLLTARRKDAKFVVVKKNKQNVKFKVRCSKYLYTLVLKVSFLFSRESNTLIAYRRRKRPTNFVDRCRLDSQSRKSTKSFRLCWLLVFAGYYKIIVSTLFWGFFKCFD